MKKMKFGYQLWTLIIIFLIISFVLDFAVKASFYLATYYLIDNGYNTLIFAASYLVVRIINDLTYDVFTIYILQKYINKKVIKNLGFATHKINNMSFQHFGREIGSGKYLSSIYENFYFPFYGATIQIFELSKMVFNLLLTLSFFLYFNWILGVVSLSGSIIFLIMPTFIYKYWVKCATEINESTNNFFEKLSNLLKFFNLYYAYDRTNKIVDKTQFTWNQNQLLRKNYFNNRRSYLTLSHLIAVAIRIAYYIISGFVIVKTQNNINQIVGLSFFSISNLYQLFTASQSFSATLSDFFIKLKMYADFWTFADGDHYSEDQLIKYEQPFESINVQGLNFNYPNKPALFQSFNLMIQKSKKYLVIGNNGSGKSTLTKLLTGIERDYSGKILFNNDIEIKEVKQTSLCRYFNWVTNKNILLDDTLRNNLTLYKDPIDDEQIRSSLATMNLSELDQLDHVYEQSKNGLSVGQVQRLDIARCLLEPKPILVLDEALSNVDVVNQERILNHFLEQKDLTLIVITHHLTSEWQQKFDQVVQL